MAEAEAQRVRAVAFSLAASSARSEPARSIISCLLFGGTATSSSVSTLTCRPGWSARGLISRQPFAASIRCGQLPRAVRPKRALAFSHISRRSRRLVLPGGVRRRSVMFSSPARLAASSRMLQRNTPSSPKAAIRSVTRMPPAHHTASAAGNPSIIRQHASPCDGRGP